MDWGLLLAKTVLCLLVLAIPPLLLVSTAYVIWRRTSSLLSKGMIALNIVVAASIAVMILLLRIGTLVKVATASYQMVISVGLFFGVLALYAYCRDKFFPDSKIDILSQRSEVD